MRSYRKYFWIKYIEPMISFVLRDNHIYLDINDIILCHLYN